MKMIEIERTYKITFTEEQLRQLYDLLDTRSNELGGTALNSIYRDLKDTFKPIDFLVNYR